VVGCAVDALLQRTSATASQLCAAIFPHIRPCCFEVGEEVAQELSLAAPGRSVVSRPGLKPHVDLAAVVRAQLLARGLDPERIDDVTGCTRCDPTQFFSYRREGQRSGRHLAVIVAR
jgi:hypothetical protein